MDFERYLSYIAQPVVILDKLHQVLTMNLAFEKLFPVVERGENLYAYTDKYPILRTPLSRDEGQYVLTYENRHYNVYVFFTRYGKRHRPVARCILFTDETEAALLLEEIERQSALLHESNARIERQNATLKESIQLEAEASAMRARSKLLRDVHDTLGHTLVMIGALYAQAVNALPDQAQARIHLIEALKWINISIAELESAEDYRNNSFIAFLYRFQSSLARAGLTVALDISGDELPEHDYMYADLMRCCQEAATNAVKHGHATQLDITYRIGMDDILLKIKDNGHAKQVIGKGFGLAGMDERVNNLFGDLDYGFDADGGFIVKIVAPLILDEE